MTIYKEWERVNRNIMLSYYMWNSIILIQSNCDMLKMYTVMAKVTAKTNQGV